MSAHRRSALRVAAGARRRPFVPGRRRARSRSYRLLPFVAGIGVLSIGALFDLAMFMPAGYVMDRFGRKWAILPSFGIHALGLALIPFTQDVWGLSVVALIVGFGNGLGSGTMMVLATDLAPADMRGEFISLWRLMGDFGTSTAPLIAGAIANALTLTPAIWVIGASGGLAVLIFGLYVPETRPQDEKSKGVAVLPQAAPEPRS